MAGIDVDITDHKGQTPLHIAAQEGNVELVELLCKYQARLVSRDKDGNTPVDLWANRRREIKVKSIKTNDNEDTDDPEIDGDNDGNDDDEAEEDARCYEDDDGNVQDGDGSDFEKMLGIFRRFSAEQDKVQQSQIDKIMSEKSEKKTDTFIKDDVIAGHLRSMTPFGYVCQSKCLECS